MCTTFSQNQKQTRKQEAKHARLLQYISSVCRLLVGSHKSPPWAIEVANSVIGWDGWAAGNKQKCSTSTKAHGTHACTHTHTPPDELNQSSGTAELRFSQNQKQTRKQEAKHARLLQYISSVCRLLVGLVHAKPPHNPPPSPPPPPLLNHWCSSETELCLRATHVTPTKHTVAQDTKRQRCPAHTGTSRQASDVRRPSLRERGPRPHATANEEAANAQRPSGTTARAQSSPFSPGQPPRVLHQT